MQRSDDVAVVKNAPIVFCCDGKARAILTGSWYRQLGYGEVYALDGGTAAWTAAGKSLESGRNVGARFDGSIGGAGEPGLVTAARNSVPATTPQEIQANAPDAILFVDTSQDFSRGHVPGARWVPRGWLEWQVSEHVASRDAPGSGDLRRWAANIAGGGNAAVNGLFQRVGNDRRDDGVAVSRIAVGNRFVRRDADAG